MAGGIVKNVSMLMASELVSKALSFILVVAIARYLGDSGLGKYSFAFAFIGIFSIFADMGLTTYLVRELSKDSQKAKKYLGNMLTIKLILALATLLLAVIIVNFVEQSAEVKTAVYIVALATAFLNMNQVFTTPIVAGEKFGYVAIANILERVLTVGIGILLMYNGRGLQGLVVAYLISYFTFMVFYIVISTRLTGGITPRFDLSIWKELIVTSLPFWFTTIFITIYAKIDTLLLQSMTNYEAVGWYNAAYKTIDALYFIPSVMIMVTFPAMSRLHAENSKQLKTLYERVFKYLLILAIPMAIGTMLLSDRIIELIYGSDFIKASPALKILIWAEAVIFISYVTGYLLNSINRQKVFTAITAIATIANIIINLILIPKYSFIGAAIATLLTEFIVLAMLMYFAAQSGYGINVLKSILKPTIAAAAMAASILLLQHQLNLFLLIGIGAATYFGLLFLMKGIGKDEIELALSLKKGFLK